MEDLKKVWPQWEIVQTLGQGGFGKVYKAKRENFGNTTYSAIKVIKIPYDQNEVKEMRTSGMSEENITSYYKDAVYSLIGEVTLMEQLKSASNIVGIEDYHVLKNETEFGWKIYIRMELLTNLYDYISLENFNKQKIIKMGIDICNALEYCHNINIIHRDIKPDNIFVTKFNDFKLGDFGVSKAVEKVNVTMSQKGTKSYMAPEMIRLSKYNHTVDLYALGLTMYELLNHGRMPFLPPFPEPFFATQREAAMLMRLEGKEFPDIEGIGDLNAIIKKACHFDPKQRYLSATEMKKDLVKASLDFVGDNNEVKVDVIDTYKTENMFGNGLFDKDKTENVFGNGLFDKDKTQNMFGNGLFDNDVTDVVIDEKDKTIGVMGNGLFDHLDVKLKDDQDKKEKKKDNKKEIEVKEEKETLPYVIKHKDKNAYKVFSYGYYDGNQIILTKEDDKTKQLKELFNKFLTQQNKKQVLKKMIELDDCAQLHYMLGKEYSRSSSKKYAREEYRKAYVLDNDDGTILKAMALTLLEEKNYNEAYEIINQSIKQCLKDECSRENTLLYAYASKAVIAKKLKKEEEALGCLVKAYHYADNYTFEVHKIPTMALLTEAAMLSFLYNINDEKFTSSSDYLIRLSMVYGIGKTIYKKIIDDAIKAHPISAFNKLKLHNFNVLFLKSDDMFIMKHGLTKSYYYGHIALYILSSVSNFDIPYVAYTELLDVDVHKINNKEIILRKNSQQIKLSIDKEHCDLLENVMIKIADKNKKLLTLVKEG